MATVWASLVILGWFLAYTVVNVPYRALGPELSDDYDERTALFSIRDGKFTGPAVKAALENIPRVYYGVVSTYEKPFSADDKDAVTPNMLVMGKVKNGAVTFAYPEDARRNLVVQRKK